LPVKLVYYEVHDGIEFAFNREKQLEGWGRKKKEALIQSAKYKLHELAECKNQSHYLKQGITKDK
jgi:predicted GIY-YIG superfamily endonuclease